MAAGTNKKSLTKQHFQKLADILKHAQFVSEAERGRVLAQFVDMCFSENENFNTKKFLEACNESG